MRHEKDRPRPGIGFGIGYHDEGVDAQEFIESALDSGLMPEAKKPRQPDQWERDHLEAYRKGLTEAKLKGDVLVNALDFFRKHATTDFDFDKGAMEISLKGRDTDGAEQILVLKIVDWSGPEYEYGFDLTGFSNEWGDDTPEQAADRAVKVWNAMKMPVKPIHAKHREFVWARDGLEIICCNNPFDVKGRPGYCSYIGLRGKKKDVMNAVRIIKKAGDVKDTSPGQLDFVGFPDAA